MVFGRGTYEEGSLRKKNITKMFNQLVERLVLSWSTVINVLCDLGCQLWQAYSVTHRGLNINRPAGFLGIVSGVAILCDPDRPSGRCYQRTGWKVL
jgi:hypothetical protein